MKNRGPYVRLRDEFRQFAVKVIYPKRRFCLGFPRSNDNNARYSLERLHYYVEAAKRLGYEVVASVDDNEELVFHYVKKRPDSIPWEAQE